MKPIKALVLSASVLALGLPTVISSAYAAQGTSEYVQNIDLGLPGMASIIHIENKSADKVLSSLNLDVKTNTLEFETRGSIVCKGSNVVHIGSNIHFGPVNITNGGQHINASSTLHSDTIDVSVLDSDNPIAESSPDLYTVPLHSVKNGHPALRVNPLEELEKARQAFNGSDLAFYQQDQEIVIKRPLSLTGACGKKNNPNKVSVGYHTREHVIQIKYKGDHTLTELPVVKVNPNLNQGGGLPNQVQQNQNLPFQLNNVTFQPNIPHHMDKCIPDQDPKIRMNFSISGGKQGIIDLRVVPVSNTYAINGTYFETQGIVKSPKQSDGGYLDFSFPLKNMLNEEQWSYMAISNNKTWSHNMRIEARFKNSDDSNEWSQWKEFDGTVFKHKCTPLLNEQLQGGNNGSIKGYDDANENGLKLDKAQTRSKRADPKPARKGEALHHLRKAYD
jgi:hypothetical protein